MSAGTKVKVLEVGKEETIDLITEEHIYGCDFVVVKCDLTGTLNNAYLLAWQD